MKRFEWSKDYPEAKIQWIFLCAWSSIWSAVCLGVALRCIYFGAWDGVASAAKAAFWFNISTLPGILMLRVFNAIDHYWADRSTARSQVGKDLAP